MIPRPAIPIPGMSYRKGDLLAGDELVIAHGCNMQGRMGRGVARAISERYPGALQSYMESFESGGLALGRVIHWKGDDRVVLNLITQDRYGRGERFVSYEAIRACFARVNLWARTHLEQGRGFFHRDPRLAIPMIGADRGGGDWDVIAAIVAEEMTSIPVTVYRL